MSKPDEKWLEQFSSVDNLKDLAAAQQNTIIQQSKKITELERELEARSGSTSLTPADLPPGLEMSAKDEEFIARFELSKFKNLSLQRSLTAEEAKTVDTYAKLLMQLNANPKKDVFDASAVSTDMLLAALDDEKKVK